MRANVLVLEMTQQRAAVVCQYIFNSPNMAEAMLKEYFGDRVMMDVPPANMMVTPWRSLCCLRGKGV